MSQPRILFMNPPYRDGSIFMKEIGRCGRRSIGGELWPQTGLGYLASSARQAGAEVQLHDAMALGWDWEKTFENIGHFKPDVIVLLCTTPTIDNDASFMMEARKRNPDAMLIAAGTHVTALPEETLHGTPADGVILGEGERVIQRIVRDWSGKLQPCPGLACKVDGAVEICEDRDYTGDLDELPDPARDLMPTRHYTMPFTEGRPFATVIPSRGVPLSVHVLPRGRCLGPEGAYARPGTDRR